MDKNIENDNNKEYELKQYLERTKSDDSQDELLKINFYDEKDVKKVIEEMKLYKKFTISEEIIKDYNLTHKVNCNSCGKLSNVSFYLEEIHSTDNDCNIYLLKGICNSCNKYMYVLFRNKLNEFEVIGVYPNRLKKKYKEINKYKKTHGNIMGDLAKALQSEEQGFYSATMLYLRRALEKLVMGKYEKHKNDLNDEQKNAFVETSSKMKSKIKALEDYLPQIVVEQKSNIYGILSKGVHELSEEECQKHYNVMKKCILYILEEDKKKLETKKVGKQIRDSVSNVATELSK